MRDEPDALDCHIQALRIVRLLECAQMLKHREDELLLVLNLSHRMQNSCDDLSTRQNKQTCRVGVRRVGILVIRPVRSVRFVQSVRASHVYTTRDVVPTHCTSDSSEPPGEMQTPDSAELEGITQTLLTSFESDGQTRQRITHSFLPTRSNIFDIVALIQRIIFPGYHGDQALNKDTVRYHTGYGLSVLTNKLAHEILYCHVSEGCCKCCTEDSPLTCREKMKELAMKFIARLPKIREMLLLVVAF